MKKILLQAAIAGIMGASGLSAAVLDSSKATADQDGKALWYDIRKLGVEGKAWDDTQAPFDRLPGRAEQKVRGAVWSLSRHSAGMAVRFVTDAPAIHARWTLTSQRLAMDHMPATGVSGLDLYARDDDGVWRWVTVGRPRLFPTNQAALVAGLPVKKREYLLYLPLYNGVSSVEIGIPSGHALETAPPYPPEHRKPIVFYGTSITHGACASRPGMCHPAIVGRRFQRPVVNLGFSGNGRMETEVAEFIAEIDAAVYVIDCLPNIGAAEVAERTQPLVRLLKRKRPGTPVLLVEDRSYADSWLVKSKRERNRTSRAALAKAFEQLKADGITGLYYLEGDHLLGDDNEGTVDSSHPNDLGFMRQADAFAKVLNEIFANR